MKKNKAYKHTLLEFFRDLTEAQRNKAFSFLQVVPLELIESLTHKQHRILFDSIAEKSIFQLQLAIKYVNENFSEL